MLEINNLRHQQVNLNYKVGTVGGKTSTMLHTAANEIVLQNHNDFNYSTTGIIRKVGYAECNKSNTTCGVRPWQGFVACKTCTEIDTEKMTERQVYDLTITNSDGVMQQVIMRGRICKGYEQVVTHHQHYSIECTDDRKLVNFQETNTSKHKCSSNCKQSTSMAHSNTMSPNKCFAPKFVRDINHINTLHAFTNFAAARPFLCKNNNKYQHEHCGEMLSPNKGGKLHVNKDTTIFTCPCWVLRMYHFLYISILLAAPYKHSIHLKMSNLKNT